MRHSMGAEGSLASATWDGFVATASTLPIPVVFTVGFMLLFSVVIALFKVGVGTAYSSRLKGVPLIDAFFLSLPHRLIRTSLMPRAIVRPDCKR